MGVCTLGHRILKTCNLCFVFSPHRFTAESCHESLVGTVNMEAAEDELDVSLLGAGVDFQ